MNKKQVRRNHHESVYVFSFTSSDKKSQFAGSIGSPQSPMLLQADPHDNGTLETGYVFSPEYYILSVECIVSAIRQLFVSTKMSVSFIAVLCISCHAGFYCGS